MRIAEINLLLAEISASKKQSAEACQAPLPSAGLPGEASSFPGKAAPQELAQAA